MDNYDPDKSVVRMGDMEISGHSEAKFVSMNENLPYRALFTLRKSCKVRIKKNQPVKIGEGEGKVLSVKVLENGNTEGVSVVFNFLIFR